MLNRLVTVNLLASTAHFADNAMRFSRYPEPHWISGPSTVVILWLAITPFLLTGWWLARRAQLRIAAVILVLYSLVSLFVVGHYAYAPVTTLPLSIHLGIAANAIAAFTLLLRAPRLLLV
jgi:hypothetical protein